MTNEEFSNEFDILINSYSIPGTTPLEFDEYEKSVFLTNAQEALVLSLYNGKSLDSFEATEENRRYLSDLVKTYSTDKEVLGEGITELSHFFNIPDDVWFITYESVVSNDTKLGCAKGSILEVVPSTQDTIYRTKQNPFRSPNKRRVLRLDVEDNKVELISVYTIDKYALRYLSKPTPIILTDLPDGLTIYKESKESECKLNPALHRSILELAVSTAINSRTRGSNK